MLLAFLLRRLASSCVRLGSPSIYLFGWVLVLFIALLLRVRTRLPEPEETSSLSRVHLIACARVVGG
jgi:hypothetical protein